MMNYCKMTVTTHFNANIKGRRFIRDNYSLTRKNNSSIFQYDPILTSYFRMMTLINFIILALNGLASAQNGWNLYVGTGISKHFFVVRSKMQWSVGVNYCHTYKMMPASIETDEDLEIVRNFLNSTTEIPVPDKSLWLPATDHRTEGRFEWLWNSQEVTIGTWAGGMPSMNRSLNCLAMNSDGLWIEESCTTSGLDRHTLCESPLLRHEAESTEMLKMNENEGVLNNKQSMDSRRAIVKKPSSLIPIGSVGTKLYFVDPEVEGGWPGNLDYCHELGMELAAPETAEEFDFIQQYSIEQAEAGNLLPIFHLAATDMLSVSCLKSNTKFRWFHSGNDVLNLNVTGNHWWYQCVYITPNGPQASTCFTGGGPFTAPLCEQSPLSL